MLKKGWYLQPTGHRSLRPGAPHPCCKITSLVLLDYVIAERWSRMNSLGQLSAVFQKRIGQCFTRQMNNDPKHTTKVTQGFLKEKNWIFFNLQVSQVIRLEHVFPRAEGRKNHKQAGNVDDCSKGLEGHLKGWNTAFGDIHGFWASLTTKD